MKTQEILYKVRSQIEVYKPIKGHAKYFVSSMGNVKNVKTGKVLKPADNGTGYLQVCLFSNRKRSYNFVHRLVAQTFIPNTENKPQVNHRDESPSNNKLSNLEWMSCKENNNYGTHNERVSMGNKRKHNGKHLVLGADGKRHWRFLTK